MKNNKKYDAYGITIEVGDTFKNPEALYDYLGEDFHNHCDFEEFLNEWNNFDLLDENEVDNIITYSILKDGTVEIISIE